MVRLLNSYVLGLVALLGVALVTSCAAPTEVTESNTSQIVESPIPQSTAGPSVTRAATRPNGTDDTSAPNSPLPTGTADSPQPGPVPVYTYRVAKAYPHDRGAWTQGLVFEKSILYEGTGKLGRSSLRTVELETGDVLRFRSLPAQLFGEGVVVYGDKIFQLTWKAHVGFVYDKDSFELLQTFTYPTEGWGLTHDGRRLIMSDGTSTLHFLDPETLEETGQVEVYDNYTPVARLNELEYIHGEVYANVWQTDRVAIIDPQMGQVTGWIDLAGLLSEEDRVEVGVLNGIAYDAENDRLFVTGKLWPKIFEIELVPE